MIKGAVPGAKGGFVLVKDSVKRKAPNGLPFPAALRTNAAVAVEGETPAAEMPEGEQS
jgi:large subunit ribosomal protein L3